MANCFADAFLTVFTDTVPPDPAPHQCCNNYFDLQSVDVCQVLEVLNKLDQNSGMGGKGVFSRFLKNLASELSFPLCKIFNFSLSESTLPRHWLYSIVVPIYKKKSFRDEPLNYRPVSLTSKPCKVLERIIVQKLCVYLE